MPGELVHVNVRNPAVRVVLILLLLGACVGSYFAIRWYIGNTMAEYYNPAQTTLDAAEMAIGFGPNDPLTHWRMAQASHDPSPAGAAFRALAVTSVRPRPRATPTAT